MRICKAEKCFGGGDFLHRIEAIYGRGELLPFESISSRLNKMCNLARTRAALAVRPR
jgi:hypothetical protein